MNETWRRWRIPLVLLGLTFLSTFWAGAKMHGLDPWKDVRFLAAGWDFALPLMAILLAHELGHYFVGRWHRIDISPPFFIPVPIMLLGTMGAVIQMRDVIRNRNALLDVGAAGPLAGLAVAIPVLVIGVARSPLGPMPAPGTSLLEGHSLLYELVLATIKGPIPEGQDILLGSTAFAGWAGLLVTMMNLLPFGQLDGGHIAYALFGPRQNRIGRFVLASLPPIAIATGMYFFLREPPEGRSWSHLLAGVHWLVWFVVLSLMSRASGMDHPPTSDEPLSEGRRTLAVAMLVLFVLLFMPSWIRES